MTDKWTNEHAVEAFLESARVHGSLGDSGLAEVRYKQALKQAVSTFGHNSERVHGVLTELANFYKDHEKTDELATVQKRLAIWNGDRQHAEPLKPAKPAPAVTELHAKLMAKRRRTAETPIARKLGSTPISPEIRHACQILGLNPSEFHLDEVHTAWKGAICLSENNPDLGGDQEVAVLLNSARDTLLDWLERHSPKLGKQFEHIVKSPKQR